MAKKSEFGRGVEEIRGTRDKVLKELRRKLEAGGYEVSKISDHASCVFVTKRKKGEEEWELETYPFEKRGSLDSKLKRWETGQV